MNFGRTSRRFGGGRKFGGRGRRRFGGRRGFKSAGRFKRTARKLHRMNRAPRGGFRI